jgi:hypothetical protein
MGQHGELERNFPNLFPNIARERPELISRFSDVNGVFCGYITEKLHKTIAEVTAIDLIDANREMIAGFNEYFKARYLHEGTRTSQHSTANALLKIEADYVASAEVVTPEAALKRLYDPEKLTPLMRGIWLAIPRKGCQGLIHLLGSELDAYRASRPFIKHGDEVFAALLEVSQCFVTKDARSLLIDRRAWVVLEIKKRVEYEKREAAFRIVTILRGKYKLSVRRGLYSGDLSDIPPKIAGAIRVYEERAPKGLGHFPELKALAIANGVSLNGHAPSTVRIYASNLAYGVRSMKLPPDSDLRDLFILRQRPIKEGGVVVDQQDYSPAFVEFQNQQREIERPDFKPPDKDTTTFSMFMKGFLAVSRFNGYFHAPKKVYDAVEVKRDRQGPRDRLFLKKQQMGIEWVDSGIASSMTKFRRYVDTGEFLHDEKALILCCALPQLLVLRTFGYRQESIRIADEGRHVTFSRDGSLRLHYDRDEMKNHVMIDQSFSPALDAGMDEILLVLEVLQKYRTRVLGAFKKTYPDHCRENVGKGFFVMPVKDEDGRLLIRRFPVAPQSATGKKKAKIEQISQAMFYTWFEHAAPTLLDFSDLKGCRFNFNPHFLRALCCQWMRDVLKWTWAQIAATMGDQIKTLQEFYYSDGLRIQTSDPFRETSNDRLAKKERKEQAANSVPLETFEAVNTSLTLTTEEKRELREEKRELKAENASLRGENALLQGQVSNLSQELSNLQSQIDHLLKKAGLTAGDLERLDEEGLVVA